MFTLNMFLQNCWVLNRSQLFLRCKLFANKTSDKYATFTYLENTPKIQNITAIAHKQYLYRLMKAFLQISVSFDEWSHLPVI